MGSDAGDASVDLSPRFVSPVGRVVPMTYARWAFRQMYGPESAEPSRGGRQEGQSEQALVQNAFRSFVMARERVLGEDWDL